LPLDLHMSGDVLTQYSEEQLLEGKQIFAHVSNLPKKLITGGKTKPLSFQKVGHENGHPKVTWFKHLIMPFGIGKC